MVKNWSRLAKKYEWTLREFLRGGDEKHLQRAYELGRTALNCGLGVLEMVRLHQVALVKLIASVKAPAATAQRAAVVETFLLEALTPFEAAHRGFRDACVRTGLLNETLKKTNHDLRESREHYFHLFRQAREMEENLRLLSNKVVSAQEEERKRISRDLHDEIGQALTAVNVSIAILKKHATPDRAFTKKVATAQELLERSMESVHRFARDLRPTTLDHLGPYAALRSYLADFSERTGIKAILQSSLSLGRLDSQQSIVLYRVVQESLTNVFKHARATRVEVRFRRIPRGVCMEIKDDGLSFRVKEQPNGHAPPRRLGLLGMQERVRLIRGEFAIASAPGRGTTVRVKIPFNSSRKIPGEKDTAGSAILSPVKTTNHRK